MNAHMFSKIDNSKFLIIYIKKRIVYTHMGLFQTALDWVIVNKEWLFGGIGIYLILWPFGFLKIILGFFNKNLPSIFKSTTIVNSFNNLSPSTSTTSNICKYTPEQRKLLTQILFIDDEASFKVINILKKAGWINTKLVKKVSGPDDDNILKADICFVDINGVAKELFPIHEGLGLVGAIKDRHSSKKVIVYSSQHQRDAFNYLWGKADARLSKNADPYEFENLIENFSEEIYC